MQRLATKLGSVPFMTPRLIKPRILTGRGSLMVDETMQTYFGVHLQEICFSPDGKLLVSGARDGVIRVCSGPCTLHDVSQFLFSSQGAQCVAVFEALGLGYHQGANQ